VVTRILGNSGEAITDPAVRALEDGRREALEASMPETESEPSVMPRAAR